MKSIKRGLKLFDYNRSSIIAFEIIYKLVSSALAAPIIYAILNLSVKLAGINYLISNTVKKYFMAPTTYLCILAVILVILVFVILNVSGIIYALEASHREEKTNPLTMLVQGTRNALRIINPKNFGLFLYALFLYPFTYTTILSGTLIINKLPEFLTVFIRRNVIAMTIIIVLYVLLYFVAMRRIYAFNYFTLYGMDYNKSVEKVKGLKRKKIWQVIGGVLIWNIVFTFLFFLFGSAFSMLIVAITKKLVSWKRARFFLNMSFEIIFAFVYLVLNLITMPVIYSYICSRFYDVIDEDTDAEFKKVVERRKGKRDSRKIRIRNNASMIILIVISLVLDVGYIYMAIRGKVSLHILYPTRASITAHRGDSSNAPENTMAAFDAAYENGADIIEIDVRQTIDGRYIIMHDESLYRTTGVRKKVGEVSYSYIQTLDAGSSFSKKYAGEKIPTLEEVIEFAIENDIYLNIELKSAKTDKDYIQGIVDILHEYDFVDKCMIGSSKYNELKQLKELDEDINTLYILHYALNNLGSMEYVDAFSIKFNYISNDLVKDIHKHDKKVYAWTVDNESWIKWLLLRDVDGIITNDPYNTKEIVYNANSSIIVDVLSRFCEVGW